MRVLPSMRRVPLCPRAASGQLQGTCNPATSRLPHAGPAGRGALHGGGRLDPRPPPFPARSRRPLARLCCGWLAGCRLFTSLVQFVGRLSATQKAHLVALFALYPQEQLKRWVGLMCMWCTVGPYEPAGRGRKKPHGGVPRGAAAAPGSTTIGDPTTTNGQSRSVVGRHGRDGSGPWTPLP